MEETGLSVLFKEKHIGEGGGDVNLPISQKIGLYVYLEE